MDFLEELKKRHVFKVGATYAIVAWLLVQAADVFVPALLLPEWVITLVAGLALAGFPIALLLAWAYEITPDGIVRDGEAAQGSPAIAGQGLNTVIMGLVVVAVAFLMADRFVFDRPSPAPAGATLASVADEPRLAAVVPLPDDAPLGVGTADIGFDSPSVALSPDGRWLVYVAQASDGGSRLMRRGLDGFDPPAPVPGSEGAIFAFFSPDGANIGFLTNDRIKRVSVTGDDVLTVAATRSPVRAQWVSEDVIHVIDDQGSALRSVRLSSGELRDLSINAPLGFSQVLPGERWALATQRQFSMNGDHAAVVRVDLDTREIEPVGISGFDPRWVSSGHLLFGRGGDLYAVAFDADSATVVGEPVEVLSGVAADSMFHQMHYSVSDAGTVAFVPGSDRAVGQIVAVDLDGNERRLPVAPQRFSVLDLDETDQLLALHVADVKDYIWVYDLGAAQGRKLRGSTGYGWPVFAPDGAIAMAENTSATIDSRILIAPGDGGEPFELFNTLEFEALVTDWSPDGNTLAMSDWSNTRLVYLTSDGTVVPEIQAASGTEWGAMYSPDGDWISFSSDESGRFEIWARPVAEPQRKRQVSANGGIESVWCPCGRIYFRRGDEFWFVPVETGEDSEEPVFGREQLAFTVLDFLDTPGRSYDVSSDGTTLYTLKRAEPAVVDRVHVIGNWLPSPGTRPD